MRYFIQVTYDGLQYAGFQIQPNATTIQSKLTQALQVILKQPVTLTGSSRTDAKVHAHSNYFMLDIAVITNIPKLIYSLNALLPPTIAVINIQAVQPHAHARFSATSRCYTYHITTVKNPFLQHRAYYYPYQLNVQLLHHAASSLATQVHFKHFCKTNTQVNNYNCTLIQSFWQVLPTGYIYTVQANRFLRGMVKALVGTSLQLATGKLNTQQFQTLFTHTPTAVANFTPPGYGLYLQQVHYPPSVFL